MKKRLLILITIAALVAMPLPLAACSELEKSGSFTYEYDSGAGTYSVKYYDDLKSVTSVTVPDEVDGVPVTALSAHSLSNSNYLTEINLGKNVSYIDSWALRNNLLLTAINVSAENPFFASVDGVLFDKSLKTLLAYPNAKAEAYTLPEGVETVADNAFYKCSGLTEVNLASTVQTIGKMCFLKCTALYAVTLGGSLKSIGTTAFLGCGELTSLTIPATVESIGEYAFYNCVMLLDVKVLREESGITLGKKWYPTKNGQDISELVISFGGDQNA